MSKDKKEEKHEEVCPQCGGQHNDASSDSTCYRCGGTGQMTCVRCTGDGLCPSCHGKTWL